MRVSSDITPRKWQLSALEVWSKEKRGIAKVVTGGGKTVFAYLCIQNFLEKYPDGRIIITVPTIALLDQWYLDILDGMEFFESHISCFSGNQRKDKPSKVNIIVLNSARSRIHELFANVPMMLVVDECHRSGSPENSNSLLGEYDATLGLSATPHRELDSGFEEYLEPYLGPICYEYDYIDAHEDKVIVDFDLINIDITIDGGILPNVKPVTSEIDKTLNKIPSDKRTEKIISALTSKVAQKCTLASRVAWAVKLCAQHKSERIIVFHERIDALSKITDLLNTYGLRAVSYHSKLSRSHRWDNLRMFRKGIVDTLVTCRALDEGANVPESNVAVIAHSTKSTRQRIQRLGRVLRPSKGKKNAVIYTLFSGDEQKEYLKEEESDLDGVAHIRWKRGVYA